MGTRDAEVIRTLPPEGRKVAVIGLALALAGATRGQVPGPNEAFASALHRNPTLTAYTFRLNATIRMRTFPWLRFRIGGNGQYVRGQSYVVHFDRMPFFAQGFSQLDLSPLDPSMWSKRFLVRVDNERDGMTTFALRARKLDPTDTNQLVEALVTLDSNYSTRGVDLHYAKGEIQMSLTPSDTEGYRLPATSEVSVNLPGRTLSAHAEFTDYTILRDGEGRPPIDPNGR
jgi:hypothetical protein